MSRSILSILLIILIFTCNKVEDKNEVVTKVDSKINGQTFLNGNNTSENYSPVGSFIQINPSQHRFWKDVHLVQNKKEIMPKEFWVEDDITFLFDSLINGEYQLKFTSHFNDEIIENVVLNKRLKIEFPAELGNYFELSKFDEFSIERIGLNDTLQILYQHFGCFSFDHKLIEYIFGESKTIVRIADWANDWKEVIIKNPIDKLSKLIKEGKEFNGIEGCSNTDYYSFRIKGENEIAIIEDGSCNWSGISMVTK